MRILFRNADGFTKIESVDDDFIYPEYRRACNFPLQIIDKDSKKRKMITNSVLYRRYVYSGIEHGFPMYQEVEN